MLAKKDSVLMTADAHVEHSSAKTLWIEKASSLTLGELSEAAKVSKPTAFVSVGDFFDAHGIVESYVGNMGKKLIEELTAAGVISILVTGNHEYPESTDKYFGSGALSLLFSGRERDGIFVIDRHARIVRSGPGTVVAGVPYRELYGQYERDVLVPLVAQISLSDSEKNKKILEESLGRNEIERLLSLASEEDMEMYSEWAQKAGLTDSDDVLVVWHVGIPFGDEWWRGDEPVNQWIDDATPGVGLLFDLSSDRTVYCGHYHGPSITKRPKGDFVYIGSPATRTRDESEQQKRVLLWGPGVADLAEDELEKMSFSKAFQGRPHLAMRETGLILDKIVGSVDDAKKFIDKSIKKFGEAFAEVATIHVKLPEGASMEDWTIARRKTDLFPCQVKVEKPRVKTLTKTLALEERRESDPNYTSQAYEVDIVHVANREHYRLASFQTMKPEDIAAFAAMDHGFLFSMARGKKRGISMGITEIVSELQKRKASMDEGVKKVSQNIEISDGEIDRLAEMLSGFSDEELLTLSRLARSRRQIDDLAAKS